MTVSPPEIAEFLTCEDIRQEVNGKVSIIGLYEDKLAFLDGGNTTWPRPLRHCVFIRVRKIPSEPLAITLSVESNGTTLFEHRGSYEQVPEAPKDELKISAALHVNVPDFGELTTRITLKNEANEVLLEKTRSLLIEPAPTVKP